MSLWTYAILDRVISTGSLRKAAEELRLTPSAVSHAIRKLESELGLQLVARSRSGVELTENGRKLMPMIRSVLSMDKSLHEEIDGIKGVLRGEVRLGVINSICCAWLPEILRNMRAAYPEIEVRIVQSGYGTLEQAVYDGELDIAFVSLPIKHDLPVVPLYRDRLVCIAPKGFHTDGRNTVSVKELKENDVIIPGFGSDYDAVNFMRENNVALRTPHSITEDSSIVALVEAGLGISIMPELVLASIKSSIEVYPIETAPRRIIGVCTKRSDLLQPAGRAMLRTIREYADEKYPGERSYFDSRRNNYGNGGTDEF